MVIELIGGTMAPTLFGLLVAATVIAVWMALSPASAPRVVTDRMESMVDPRRLVEGEMRQSFFRRMILPLFHRISLRVAEMMPQHNIAKINTALIQAGNPGNLTAVDYIGLRVVMGVGAGAVYLLLIGHADPFFVALRNAFIALFIGFMAPKLWLSQRIKKRKLEIRRSLPDALDMLTIGVEAGLAFESAMLRVGEQWDNALSQEFRRVVSEMRVGVPRNEALRHMAERTQVDELRTFVAVLIQSNMLGMSIAQVLHTQADQMRLKRRQLAEEQAHSATVKIVMVLVVFIFPALFVVVLGPVIPKIMESLQAMAR
ncbi:MULTISPECIES: type II secretion system F family protein [Caldilinea]|jgi:tight adherence protein C|uniref:Putative bacterial type II secretion system protein n=1 Tax=Caldilinea aerophila (strain DSM 14535 / JCM 11387 / NBRC 104270 / STL-6-O1) TaxID=926550 RepID=I0I8M5_CALAS|nr:MULTISPECIES: type II secretion system F family protein [Caldilinea]MBO9393060.1 type II secretion system F family protein [Caldilinea sp.]BAM01613.1 putative bacterial type II secretion system protein [Caldilinea aerophila DSM 14535 = NBRC 104270]GIV72951.1 MAG: type II secretion system protein [Caldilinea sp.]